MFQLRIKRETKKEKLNISQDPTQSKMHLINQKKQRLNVEHHLFRNKAFLRKKIKYFSFSYSTKTYIPTHRQRATLIFDGCCLFSKKVRVEPTMQEPCRRIFLQKMSVRF